MIAAHIRYATVYMLLFLVIIDIIFLLILAVHLVNHEKNERRW